MKLAIVGSGISGLAVAHTLKDHADITVFEAGDYFGGHTHTVDVTLPTPQGMVTHGVDTGFLVFNERTYPNLINLFAELQVETAPSDMSFSVKVPGALNGKTLEWSGTDLNSVFAQRSNLVNPRFWRMLADVMRFNALCTRIAKEQREKELQQPLSDFLRTHKFSEPFRDWYFLPMLGCIWSCPTDQMLQFPVATMIRFCHNHGLIQVTNRPQWFSVVGGARNYVEKILTGVHDKRLNSPVRLIERDAQGVRVITDGHAERFDQVVIATHTDQALGMLREPSTYERSLLGAIRYQDNRAVLHTDASVLPANPKTWAAWNYERAASSERESSRVCLHYLLNRLQRIPFAQPVVVSLNPLHEIDPATIVGEYDYAHPVFDLAAIEAQKRLPLLQGQQHTWYAGAWTGYGFHEDGLKSGLQVGRALLKLIHEQASPVQDRLAA
ncbi:NAD(P)/FAD-dependent oxidoreductase [Limnohabitans sp. Bal53]|uniref:NAD(P)/FAD-dependent oxidoreductase n=1 Tax=Limnohabitans sp. Bal53 TaxID=1977910 RepID=UPI000D3D90E7|nr:FAD-dependent oxidoreductase [Limnohabitans sp. Bal53]PUE39481.1 NAD/FAD-binding protein [Limnohabitans sp. Bal53]